MICTITSTEEQPNPCVEVDQAAQKAEARRLMYERIAQGHALAEIEENATRQWQR